MDPGLDLLGSLPVPADAPSWYGLFFVYSFTCKLVLLWGIYAFVALCTRDRSWAFLGTILASIGLTYWQMNNGHAFPAGLMLLLLAKMIHKGSLDVWSALACTALSFLFRPEYVFPAAGWAAWFVWKQAQTASWRRIFIPGKTGVIFIFVVIGLWLPVISRGRLNTDRLSFAFAQKFRNYAVSNQLDKRIGLPPDADWFQVLDAFFPPDQRDHHSLPARWIPLYDIASANPQNFARYVWANARPFLIGNFPFTPAKSLSRIINFYVYLSLGVFMAWVLLRKSPPDTSLILVGSLIFIATGVPPCLLIQPLIYYVYPAVIWFTLVIPYFWIRHIPWRLPFAGSLILAVLAGQSAAWFDLLRQHSTMTNWKRAMVIQEAGKQIALQGATIAEAYPVFCSAFAEPVPRSLHYPTGWDAAGRLLTYGEGGIPVNFILFEKNPPPHLGPATARMQTWMQKWGELLVARDGYSLWKVHRRQVAPPGTVVITDDLQDETDLAGREDADAPDNRQLVIHWNFGGERFADYHVYVAVDENPFQYLGRPGSGEARLFPWNTGNPQLNPRFAAGPEFGHQYRFQVFAIPVEDSGEKPIVLTNQHPVQFQKKTE